MLTWSAAGLAAFAGLGAAVFAARGLPQRMPQAVIAMDASRQHDLTYPEGLTVSGEAPEYFVWGDSHAFSFLPVLTELFDDHGKQYATKWKTGGVPLTGITRGAEFKCCNHTGSMLTRWYTRSHA